MESAKRYYAKASVLKRLLAFIADMLIINLTILWPFRSTIESMLPKYDSFSKTLEYISKNQGSSGKVIIIMLCISLLTILYFYLLEKKLGQTAGKMLFGLYVRSTEKELKRWQIFARSIFLIPAFPFILLWIADPIVIFFNRESQRLSEIISKTKVVEEYKI